MSEEAKIRHLEMIQSVIARMNQNSFLFKGWAITLIAAVLALVQVDAMDPRCLLVGLVPALAFWYLDGFCLWQERVYRRHYDAVRLASPEDWSRDPFSMQVSRPLLSDPTWLKACLSTTVAGLYIPLGVAVALVTALSVYR
jgi:hypothetical protein